MTRNFPLPNLNLQNSNLPKFSTRNWKTGKKGDSNDRLSPSLDSRLQGKLGKGRKRLSWLGEGSVELRKSLEKNVLGVMRLSFKLNCQACPFDDFLPLSFPCYLNVV
ncbi:hypothetical protein COLO4_25211 [Corchorus olitorius]|uniref:Uncharacterized protein n=1 Tax=Corchorus olitorius TaxID=93759 RepID=A0A1R3I494_9ROSI|nr:hypothetical protein COLO4_25211 [Corchorus olitorius]